MYPLNLSKGRNGRKVGVSKEERKALLESQEDAL
jgi:hypothetical protein